MHKTNLFDPIIMMIKNKETNANPQINKKLALITANIDDELSDKFSISVLSNTFTISDSSSTNLLDSFEFKNTLIINCAISCTLKDFLKELTGVIKGLNKLGWLHMYTDDFIDIFQSLNDQINHAL